VTLGVQVMVGDAVSVAVGNAMGVAVPRVSVAEGAVVAVAVNGAGV
jgi:hypothetical protein